ncbi:vivid PAS protein VVD [Colletotrichum karsti]|uniref:Vivid PAS protein VVD n=1 Tax=Colletotrichum karsti TaxID=1095194 RepID=A0A9P6LHF1_9PEZI|nr:vivid PAS protein VVD [Colletotrichum karsti]KAF9876209.1 vivid PAS protein VVD [Colletotrichum karsti]
MSPHEICFEALLSQLDPVETPDSTVDVFARSASLYNYESCSPLFFTMTKQEIQYPAAYLQSETERILSFRAHYQVSSTMNPWESCALQYQYPDESDQTSRGKTTARRQQNAAADPVMYPGLYCPSGFDMMSILLRVAGRPNPKVSLGAIDCSVALILCDLEQPDTPIVYASEHFSILTGYSNKEIMGKNCRFLQAPGGKVRQKSARKNVDKDTIKQMKRAVETNDEFQTEVLNFKKDGTPFVNILTMIPVHWDSPGFRYSVGFQVERED